MKVAFLGLGAMGYPMAGHLKKAGLDVCVYNRTQKRAEQWVNKFSGQLAASPAEAAAHSDFVFACVGGDADLRAVTLGQNGAFAGMKSRGNFCRSYLNKRKNRPGIIGLYRGHFFIHWIYRCAGIGGTVWGRKRPVDHHVWWSAVRF